MGGSEARQLVRLDSFPLFQELTDLFQSTLGQLGEGLRLPRALQRVDVLLTLHVACLGSRRVHDAQLASPFIFSGETFLS